MHRPAPALLLALAAATLAACGGSSGPRPELYQGFTPLEGTAVVFPRSTCDVAFVGPTSAVGVAVTLTDFAGTCDFLAATGMCGSRAGSTFIMAAAVDGAAGGAQAPAVPRAGAYPFLSEPPTGAFRAAIGTAVRTDAVCAAQPGTSLDMTGGSIVISSITDTRVTGSLNLVFEDGTGYQHPFDLARCAPPVDICNLLTFGACIPGFDPWQCVQPAP